MKDINISDFSGTKLNTTELTMILFKADNCPYCDDFLPLYKKLSNKYKTLSFSSFNMGDIKEINSPGRDFINNLNKSGIVIKTFPTILLFKNGFYLGRFLDDRTEVNLNTYINNLL